jgi:hypothetical protein
VTGKYKGEKNPFYGKKHSDELRKAVSDRFKGCNLSEDHKGKISKANKGRKWYNNGVKSIMVFDGEIPEGFIKGRLKN